MTTYCAACKRHMPDAVLPRKACVAYAGPPAKHAAVPLCDQCAAEALANPQTRRYLTTTFDNDFHKERYLMYRMLTEENTP